MNRQRLAERFFLITHDEFSGKLRISPELLGCGLVCAELADLMLVGRLDAVDDRVIVTNRHPHDDDDPVSAFVMESVQLQPAVHTVRTWCENLSESVQELVARRLIEDDVLHRVVGGGVIRRRSDRYPAKALLRAVGPRLRLEHMLRTPSELDLAGALLAALLRTLDAERVLDPSVDRAAARQLVDGVMDNLPTSLRALVDGAASAVAAVSLRVRR